MPIGKQSYRDIMRFYLLYRRSLTRFSALYFVINALCWFALGVYWGGVSVGLLALIWVNVALLALLVMSTGTFGKIKPIELLTDKSTFLSANKILYLKDFTMAVPLLGVVSVYAYAGGVVLAALYYAPDFLAIGLRYFTRHEQRRKTLATLTAYEPTVCAYVTGAAKSAYQINMWLETLEKLAPKTIILTTDRNIYKAMQKTKLPVVFASNTDDVFNVFDTGIKCVLYPANGQKNSLAFRYSQATHCFINHGESDKGVNANKLLMSYDRLFLAGNMALDRMVTAGLPVRDGQVTFVGRPQQEMNLEKRSRQGLKKVLYAPTWEGFVEPEDYTSIDTIGLEAIKTLHQTGKYEIVFRPHPFTGRRRKAALAALQETREFCKDNGIRISENTDETIYQAMNACDVMLSDISSVMVDFLYTEKPMILCRGLEPDAARLKQMPSAQAAYHLAQGADAADLLAAIDQDDTLSAVRQTITQDYIVASGVGSFDRFSQAVQDSVDG